ncbi:MAG: hypothetical protein HN348_28195, partial [Proteobacteria bacterium]|nr:hypothetical protein [Pseudomonadota bacterium]
DGGAIYVENSDLFLDEVEFKLNSATASGGAIYISNEYTAGYVGTYVDFERNTAADYGGAVYAENTAFEQDFGSLFKNITKDGTQPIGGGIAAFVSSVDLDGMSISENEANYGGALYLSTSTLTVSNSTLATNFADSDGGAIYIAYGDGLDLTQNTITDNSGYDGGALYWVGLDAVVGHNTFERNDAARYGGAAFGLASDQYLEGNEFFHNNASQQGGALFLEDAEASSMGFNNFCKNSVDNSIGGAMSFKAPLGQTDIYQSVFVENEAPIAGGAISVNSAQSDVIAWANNFLGNSTPAQQGSAFYAYDSDIGFHINIVTHSQFSNAIRLEGGTADLTYNVFWQNAGSDYSDSSGGSLDDSNEFMNPMLMDYSALSTDDTCDPIGNYRLKYASPLRDRGPDNHDLDGSVTDVGAFGAEPGVDYWFYDDDADGFIYLYDCDDDDYDVNPGATEVCDGKDNDCDFLIDDADNDLSATSYYPDVDGDSFGDIDGEEIIACQAPENYIDDDSDCDDETYAINPNASEICDGEDNNCDGETDDDDDDLDLDSAYDWYRDKDGDGYGNDNTATRACLPPDVDYIEDITGDCNDNNFDINPEAIEICDEDIDNNCDGLANDDDDDLDLTSAKRWYPDTDKDDFGDPNGEVIYACEKPKNYVSDNTDCDDTNTDINPEAIE